MILGIALFNLGVDISLMPIGENIGAALVKSKNLIFIIFLTFLIGVFVTVQNRIYLYWQARLTASLMLLSLWL